MVAIKLPDGSILEMESGVNGFDIANKISSGLAKAALAITVNGTTQDLSTPITTDATVTIITGKDKEGLHILRHSCSHVMAQAVKELWKDVQVTIGPAIEPEAFGRISIEGQALGKIVVASNIGGSVETIRDGETGKLFYSNNAQSLAEAIDWALDLPADEIEKISKAAIKNVRDNFTKQIMCDKTVKVYEEILNLEDK